MSSRKKNMKLPNPNPGTSKFSRLRLISNKANEPRDRLCNKIEKALPSCESFSTDVSPVKCPLNYSIDSPYKSCVTEINSESSQVEDEADFKTPKLIRATSKKVITKGNTKSKTNLKSKKSKQRKLEDMLKINLESSDVNPEHLQMALALSRSTFEKENSLSHEQIDRELPKIPSPTETSAVRKTLDEFGFRSNRSRIEGQHCRDFVKENLQRRKRSRYQYITPVLFIRTEEDRASLITSKISLILTQQSSEDIPLDKITETTVFSNKLRKYLRRSDKLFNINNRQCMNEIFYTELPLSPSKAPSGCLLKNWKDIPGRESTPPRHKTSEVANTQIFDERENIRTIGNLQMHEVACQEKSLTSIKEPETGDHESNICRRLSSASRSLSSASGSLSSASGSLSSASGSLSSALGCLSSVDEDAMKNRDCCVADSVNVAASATQQNLLIADVRCPRGDDLSVENVDLVSPRNVISPDLFEDSSCSLEGRECVRSPSLVRFSPEKRKIVDKDLEEDVTHLKKCVRSLNKNLRENITTLGEDIMALDQDIMALDEDIMTLDEDTKTMDADTKTMDEDTKTMDEDTKTIDEDTKTMDENNKTMDDIKTSNEGTRTLAEGNTASDKDSSTLDEGTTTLNEDSMALDKDVTVLDKDVIILDEDVIVLGEDVTALDEDATTFAKTNLVGNTTILDKDVWNVNKNATNLNKDNTTLDAGGTILNKDVTVTTFVKTNLVRNITALDTEDERFDKNATNLDKDNTTRDEATTTRDKDTTTRDKDTTTRDKDATDLDEDVMVLDKDVMALDEDVTTFAKTNLIRDTTVLDDVGNFDEDITHFELYSSDNEEKVNFQISISSSTSYSSFNDPDDEDDVKALDNTPDDTAHVNLTKSLQTTNLKTAKTSATLPDISIDYLDKRESLNVTEYITQMLEEDSHASVRSCEASTSQLSSTELRSIINEPPPLIKEEDIDIASFEENNDVIFLSDDEDLGISPLTKKSSMPYRKNGVTVPHTSSSLSSYDDIYKNQEKDRLSSLMKSSSSQDSIVISDEELNYSSRHYEPPEADQQLQFFDDDNFNINDLDDEPINISPHPSSDTPNRNPFNDTIDKILEDEILLNNLEKQATPKHDFHRSASMKESGGKPKKYPFKRFQSDQTETPKSGVIISNDNVTPMSNFDEMDTPNITRELDKFGLKPLKRKRAVKMLKYIYEATHPFVGPKPSPESSEDGGGSEKSKKRKLETETNERDVEVVPLGEVEDVHVLKRHNNMDTACEIVGDLLLKNEKLEDLIFERRRSSKIPSCAVPLQIVWFNFISCNPKIKENILLYEPLQLEVLHGMLKEVGYRFNIHDLLNFLDKKCITVRIAQGSQKKS